MVNIILGFASIFIIFVIIETVKMYMGTDEAICVCGHGANRHILICNGASHRDYCGCCNSDGQVRWHAFWRGINKRQEERRNRRWDRKIDKATTEATIQNLRQDAEMLRALVGELRVELAEQRKNNFYPQDAVNTSADR